MSEYGDKGPATSGKILLIAVVVSALLGATVAFAVTSMASPRPPAQKREFYVFTTILSFNETLVGLPHDAFTPDHILVEKGDTVTVHFYNTETEQENHTFTIDAPYTVNIEVANGQHADVTFVASYAGTFAYRCTLHQPTMTGYLMVES